MSSNDNAIPVAVVGVGRMGRHHARTLSQNIPGADLVGVVDGDLPRAAAVAKEYGSTPYPSVDALLEAHPNVKAAVVAVPTVYHADAATPLLQRGIATLIEKPLDGSAQAARALADIARKHNAVLQVGHTERFNPIVRALSQLGWTPRLIQVTRVSPMTFRSMDVSVVMDMMIHDLDIVLSLVGQPIERVEATGAAVLGDHVDLCDARLTFADGCVVSIRGSRLATGTERTLRLYSDRGYVALDYGDRTGTVIEAEQNTESLVAVRDLLGKGEDLSDRNYLDLLIARPLEDGLPPGNDDPLTAQAKSFLDCVVSGSRPVVSADDGIAAVDAAERILAAIAGGGTA